MDRILSRAQRFLLALALVYICALVLLTTPFFQRHALFMHSLRWPPFSDFTKPEKYGLPVHRTSHFFVDTRDGERLGAWIVLPEVPKSSDSDIPLNLPSNDTIKSSISSKPTIIYLHGNAASRAVSYRAQQVTAFSSRYHSNVLSIDYRGFGDSTGSPSQEGLLSDALAAWNWVMERGGRPHQTLLVGISLGTAVATELGAILSSEGVKPKGIVLLAPFSTLESLLDDYHIFGIIPILQPLQSLPFLSKFLKRFLTYKFDSVTAIKNIDAPILIAHSKDDSEIPYTHSEKLFSTLLEPLLPPVPSIPSKISELSKFDWPAHQRLVAERASQREHHVQSQVIEKFGTIRRFRRTSGHDVVFVESKYGGHDKIGLQGTVIDIIGAFFDLP